MTTKDNYKAFKLRTYVLCLDYYTNRFKVVTRLAAVPVSYFKTGKPTKVIDAPFKGTDYLWRIYTKDLDTANAYKYVRMLKQTMLDEFDRDIQKLSQERKRFEESELELESN